QKWVVDAEDRKAQCGRYADHYAFYGQAAEVATYGSIDLTPNRNCRLNMTGRQAIQHELYDLAAIAQEEKREEWNQHTCEHNRCQMAEKEGNIRHLLLNKVV